MDSDAPVSRETWAPRSPPPNDRYEQRGPPPQDVDMRDARDPRDMRDRRDERDPRDDRDPRDARPRDDDRLDRSFHSCPRAAGDFETRWQQTPALSTSLSLISNNRASTNALPPMASPVPPSSPRRRSERFHPYSPRRDFDMLDSQPMFRGGVDHYSPSPTSSFESLHRSPPSSGSYRRRFSLPSREGGRPAAAPSRPPNAPAVDPNPVLGVFGLSIRTRERDLEDEFARFGDVEKVVIVYDQRTDRSRGFGFITMRTTEDAARCIEKLNGIVLHGRAIRVDYSATNKAHAPTPGEYRGEKRPFDDRMAGPGPRRFGGDRYGDRYDPRDSRDRRWGGDRGGRWGGDRDDRRGGGDRFGGGGDRYGPRGDRGDRGERGGDREEGGWGPRGGRDARDTEDPYAGRARRNDGERGFGREPRGEREERRRTPSPGRFRPSNSPDRRPPPEESRDQY